MLSLLCLLLICLDPWLSLSSYHLWPRAPDLTATALQSRAVWKSCAAEPFSASNEPPTAEDLAGLPQRAHALRAWPFRVLRAPSPDSQLSANASLFSGPLRFVTFLSQYDPASRSVLSLFMLYRLPAIQFYPTYEKWRMDPHDQARLEEGLQCQLEDAAAAGGQRRTTKPRIQVHTMPYGSIATVACEITDMDMRTPDEQVRLWLVHPRFVESQQDAETLDTNQSPPSPPLSVSLSLCRYAPLPFVSVTWCGQPMRRAAASWIPHFVAWHAMLGVHRFILMDRGDTEAYATLVREYNQPTIDGESVSSHPLSTRPPSSSPVLLHLYHPWLHPDDSALWPSWDQIVSLAVCRWHASGSTIGAAEWPHAERTDTELSEQSEPTHYSTDWISTQDADEYTILNPRHEYSTLQTQEPSSCLRIATAQSDDASTAPSMLARIRLVRPASDSALCSSVLGNWLESTSAHPLASSATSPSLPPPPSSIAWLRHDAVRVATLWMSGDVSADGDIDGSRSPLAPPPTRFPYSWLIPSHAHAFLHPDAPLLASAAPPSDLLPRSNWHQRTVHKVYFRSSMRAASWNHGIMLDDAIASGLITPSSEIRMAHMMHLGGFRFSKMESSAWVGEHRPHVGLDHCLFPIVRKDLALERTQQQLDRWITWKCQGKARNDSDTKTTQQKWLSDWLSPLLPACPPALPFGEPAELFRARQRRFAETLAWAPGNPAQGRPWLLDRASRCESEIKTKEALARSQSNAQDEGCTVRNPAQYLSSEAHRAEGVVWLPSNASTLPSGAALCSASAIIPALVPVPRFFAFWFAFVAWPDQTQQPFVFTARASILTEDNASPRLSNQRRTIQTALRAGVRAEEATWPAAAFPPIYSDLLPSLQTAVQSDARWLLSLPAVLRLLSACPTPTRLLVCRRCAAGVVLPYFFRWVQPQRSFDPIFPSSMERILWWEDVKQMQQQITSKQQQGRNGTSNSHLAALSEQSVIARSEAIYMQHEDAAVESSDLSQLQCACSAAGFGVSVGACYASRPLSVSPLSLSVLCSRLSVSAWSAVSLRALRAELTPPLHDLARNYIVIIPTAFSCAQRTTAEALAVDSRTRCSPLSASLTLQPAVLAEVRNMLRSLYPSHRVRVVDPRNDDWAVRARLLQRASLVVLLGEGADFAAQLAHTRHTPKEDRAPMLLRANDWLLQSVVELAACKQGTHVVELRAQPGSAGGASTDTEAEADHLTTLLTRGWRSTRDAATTAMLSQPTALGSPMPESLPSSLNVTPVQLACSHLGLRYSSIDAPLESSDPRPSKGKPPAISPFVTVELKRLRAMVQEGA